MDKKKIEEKLKTYVVPDYDEQALTKTIQAVHNIKIDYSNIRMNNFDFFISQIGFIRKRVWFIQFLMFLGICNIFLFSIKDSVMPYSLFSLLSITAPLIIMTNIEEMVKVCNYTILEIEFSTRNSLQKVMMARMTIFSIADLIIICFVMIIANHSIEIKFIQMIVYCLVPFNVMCIGCMEIINNSKGKSTNYYCFIYGITLIAFITIMLPSQTFKNIYEFNNLNKWVIIFIITTIMLIFEAKKTYKKFSTFENIYL